LPGATLLWPRLSSFGVFYSFVATTSGRCNHDSSVGLIHLQTVEVLIHSQTPLPQIPVDDQSLQQHLQIPWISFLKGLKTKEELFPPKPKEIGRASSRERRKDTEQR